MKNLLFIVFLFTTIPIISSYCEDNQIDINTASEEELDELYGIGSVKAQAIIDSRDFDSVDDLIKTNGVGEVTLNKIKEQGLACVEGEENSERIDEQSSEEELSPLPSEWGVGESAEGILESNGETITINKNPEPILLNSINTKDIKTENNVESDKTNYAFYGFILFCILIAFLFFIRKEKFKNEFR